MQTINVAPNKLQTEPQVLDFGTSNVLTLVGENGCGKSIILEKVFRDLLSQNDTTLIGFTSGQNESFSSTYNGFIRTSRKFLIDNYIIRGAETEDERLIQEKQRKINSFYFDSTWSRILIFFATTIRVNGKTRQFLREKGIIDESNNIQKDDMTTRMSFHLRVRNAYIGRLAQDDYRLTTDDSASTIRSSVIHELLDKLTTHFFRTYDFSGTLRSQRHSLTSYNAFRVLGNDVNKIFTFLSHALKNDQFILKNSLSLYFKNSLELNDLSDGEFQLLTVYALIDLFDSEHTLFLLDEIDSHIHYTNTNKLWQVLRNINGKLLTTTHSADSIILNKPENIRLVDKGKIEENHTAEHLFKRLANLSENETYKYKLASRFEYIALIENKFDWFIFIQLAKRKIPGFNSAIEDMQVVSCSSGYNSSKQEFADSRKKWVSTLLLINNSTISTKNIYFICDRDQLPIGDISVQNGVQVTGHRNLPEWGNKKTPFLLAWKRREIENYLLSHTMLSANGLLNDINGRLPGINPLVANVPNENNDVRNLDIKSVLQPLYLKDGTASIGTNEEGVDYGKLLTIINQIPPEEISEDIVNMYTFIISKMA